MAISAPKRMVHKPKRRKKRKVRTPRNRVIETAGSAQGGPRSMAERPNVGKPARKPVAPKKVLALYPQINEWIADAFTKMGSPELIGKVPWEWNPLLTRVMGRAWGSRKMDFSPELFGRATEEERKETVYHECAHIVDHHQGTYVQGKAHGESFKRIMRRAGYAGNRCHRVKVVRRKDRGKRPARLRGPVVVRKVKKGE